MADQEKQVDQLLDSLLADYSDVEPGPGLETRLLANLRADPFPAVKNQWRVWRWFFATVGAVAVAAILFTIYLTQLSNLPHPPKIKAAKPPVLLPARPLSVPEASHHPPRLTVKPAPLVNTADVRQEVFPTPVPLSEQEALMLRYLAGTPRSEVAVHAHEDEQSEKDAPLQPETQRLNGTEGFSTR